MGRGLIMLDYDDGHANLASLIDSESAWLEKRNEATTRLHLIDTLFFDCLGWSRQEHAILEESYQGEYADYTFLAPRKIMIVEAKREGDAFKIPAGRTRLEYALPSLLRDNARLKAAVEQAAGYCQQRGVLRHTILMVH